MKNFLKNFLTKTNLFLVLIFLLAAFVRFYNFPSRVTFWSEQARSLIVSANYIKEKPSLLGQEYFRRDSNSHIIYSGAFFNYSLVPLLLISNYDPIIITMFFALLNLFTGFVVFWVAKRIFNEKIALISTILFLLNDFMVYHSLFIWNYNYLPLVGVLIFYLSFLNLKKESAKKIFLLGILCGMGIGLQILFAAITLFVLITNIWISKNKFKNSSLFTIGVALGNLPLIFFDLRHNFFQSKTILQYLVDTILGKSDAGFAYYYLLPFWPVAALLAGVFVYKMFRWNYIFGSLILVIYLILNLTSQRISFTAALGMPKGITVSDTDKASQLIADDSDKDFNIAEVLDFDKRAYVFRYFLRYKYDKKPQGEMEYTKTKLLYVLAQKDYNFKTSDTWEINSGGPYNVKILTGVGDGYLVYKLTK